MKWTDKLFGESAFNSVNSLICTLLILDSGEHLSACISISMQIPIQERYVIIGRTYTVSQA